MGNWTLEDLKKTGLKNNLETQSIAIVNQGNTPVNNGESIANAYKGKIATPFPKLPPDEVLKKKGLEHNYAPLNDVESVVPLPGGGFLISIKSDYDSKTIIAQRIPVKPLSVNEAFKGHRYKTDKYKAYEKIVKAYLQDDIVPEGRYELKLLWGLSSLNADLDNPCKSFLDILQKKYGFNDRHIYKLTIEKVDVKKGEEFIEFQLSII